MKIVDLIRLLKDDTAVSIKQGENTIWIGIKQEYFLFMTDAYFFVKNIKAKDQNLIEIDLYEE
jgi:hypothetical protein